MFRPLKYIILGNSSVGKSSIMSRYLYEHFKENNYQTIGVDFGIKTIYYKGDPIKINIWDLAGQERYTTIIRSYFRNVEAILLVFDLNNKQSFEDLDHWYNLIEEEYNLDRKNEYLPIVFLVGNKYDMLIRQISDEDIKKFMEERKIDRYMEASAKTNFNIDEIFDTLNHAVIKNIKKYDLWNSLEIRPIINLDNYQEQKSYCCSRYL